jgi:alpha-tubulin suppressor-like RCC1 family protein
LRHRLLIAGAVLLTLASILLSTPTQAAAGDIPMTIAAGNNHTLVARGDEVWAWGHNSWRQLGYNGGGTGKPHLIVGLHDVIAVAGTTLGSLALQADGSVWAWGLAHQGPGYDYYGEAPARKSGLPPVKAMAAGNDHVLLLSRDGRVWAWGKNSSGQLGVGDVAMRVDPLDIIGLENVIAVAAGPSLSVALKADGSVWYWGNGNPDPSQIPGLTDAVAIQAGPGKVIALKRDGTVWTFANQELKQARGLENVVAISQSRGNGGYLLALRQDGTVWLWNPLEQLADRVPGLSQVTQIAAGEGHYVALTADGKIATWGSNFVGQLGNGTVGGGSTKPSYPVLTEPGLPGGK